MADCCKCGNERSSSIKCEEFLERLRTFSFSGRTLLHGVVVVVVVVAAAIKRNSLNGRGFIKYIIPCQGRQLRLIAPGAKKEAKPALMVGVLRTKTIYRFELQEVVLLISCAMSRNLNRVFPLADNTKFRYSRQKVTM